MTTAENVTIIPPKEQQTESRDKYHQLRVAAYCRVSTEQEEQQNSYEIKIFDHNEFGRIRTVMIDGEVWFVGKDVAVALG